MRHRKRNSCIYRRGQRWWGDFRSYADVGGRLEGLLADGERLATTDKKVATVLFGKRIKHYEALRRNRVMTGIAEQATLADYAEYHLDLLKRAALSDPTARPRIRTVRRYAEAIANIIEHFGADVVLDEITPERLSEYIAARRRMRGRGSPNIAAATIRQELVALSRLMKRAISERRAQTNPVALCVDRPKISRPEAVWLEINEAAALLDAAGQLDGEQRNGCSSPIRFLYVLFAYYLLTGGRSGEVRGSERSDIDFARGVVRFRDNRWRKLKTGGERVVPLWPQLRDILSGYLDTSPRHISGLLFPSPINGRPISDFRSSLVRACKLAGIEKHVTPHTLRHTYTAARLRTFHTGPNGQPIQVSAYYVARELGHSSVAMIERVYGHVLAGGELQPEVSYESAEPLEATGGAVKHRGG